MAVDSNSGETAMPNESLAFFFGEKIHTINQQICWIGSIDG